MSPSSFRRRPDGLVEIVRTAPPPRRLDPQAVMFALLLVVIGLFITGRLPIQAVALLAGSWFAVEFLIGLDAMLEERRPLAEVRALPAHSTESLQSRHS
jgi:hypothetical protein